LSRRIGDGGCGAVSLGTCHDIAGDFAFTDLCAATDLNHGEEIAVKIELHKIDPSLIDDGYGIYKSLAGRTGIPEVHWFGRECEYRVMAFELLGPSHEDLFSYCGRVFSLKTVLMPTDQIIPRVQCIHSKNVIHQDIKPDSFLMGRERNGNVST
jgi:serine/threonine protein kinase